MGVLKKILFLPRYPERMRHRGLITFILASTAFFSCAPALQVTYDYDRNVNFRQYKTFAMLNLEHQSGSVSMLNSERIIKAIKAEMVKKGLVENKEQHDLTVNAVTIFKEKMNTTATTDYYNYGGPARPYGWNGMGTGVTTYQVDYYLDGSLIIDILDSKTGKLIWEGIGNKEIDGPITDPDTRIPAAIAKIMAKFPPVTAAD